jgi:hypothetical protein
MGLIRTILALVMLGVSAQAAYACTEREPANTHAQFSDSAPALFLTAGSGTMGEERPGCECPCQVIAFATAASNPEKASHSTGAGICSRPWFVVQPLSPVGGDRPFALVASPPTAPRYLLVARLLQ